MIFGERDSWNELHVNGKPWPPKRPWYAARGPREPYEWPELKQRARLTRRLIRRYWFALMFEPQSPIAASVRACMEAEPKRPKKPERWEEKCAAMLELQRLLDSGAVTIDSKAVEEFAKELGFK